MAGRLGAAAAMLMLAFCLPNAAARAEDVAYQVEITGVADDDLRQALRDASQLVALKDKPPATLLGLRRRADGDGALFARVLASRGYYSGSADISIETLIKPVKVVVAVTPGPLYKLAAYDIAYTPDHKPPASFKPDLEALGLKLGAAAESAKIVDAEPRLLAQLAKDGHPLAKIANRRVLADRDKATITVKLTVDAGPAAKFGATAFIGLVSVDEAYLRRRIPWREGERYNAEQLAALRRTLTDSRLFSSVKITPDTKLDAKGELPVTVAVTEAKPRSVGVGASYSTNEGPGGKLFWEHRNLFGEAESLRIELNSSFIDRSGTVDFRKPDFLATDVNLLGNGYLRDQTTEAFTSRNLGGGPAIEWSFAEHYSASAGINVEGSRVSDNVGTRTFFLVGLPFTLKRDTSDNLLNPTRGTRATFTSTPYLSALGSDLTFVSNRIGASAYQKLDKDGRVVLAGRAALGSIVGQGLNAIPGDKRLYAGGGGSVRGYAYQLAGPIDSANDPTGGRSEYDFGVEARVRIGEDWGVVPFIEAGRAYTEVFPDFSRGPLWSAGLGVRYYTSIGPIRLDFAVPLSRRSAVDSAFQIYVSLGQAF
ncbi:MAG: autotransporter assembly complex protein TamA [Candidatus Eiseniibacteriota bacterium]